MTDAELLHGVKRNEAPAWEALCARYLDLVWRYAYTLTSDRAAAEDILSETMLALVAFVPQIDPEHLQVFPWLIAVVRHKVQDHFRKASRNTVKSSCTLDAVPERDNGTDPAVPLEQVEMRQTVAAVLDQLPNRARLALEWKYVENLSVREIANRFGQTEKAVESLLFRARSEIREKYRRQDCDTLPHRWGTPLSTDRSRSMKVDPT